jgi:phosphoglycerate dehydrogenase-like enzyme
MPEGNLRALFIPSRQVYVKILIHTPTDPTPIAEALDQPGISPVILPDLKALAENLSGAQGLIIGASAYAAAFDAIMAHGAQLRWIQLSASGYDVVEELGARAGVQVMRAMGVWGKSVAGHALALLLALMRKTDKIVEAQKQQSWIRAALQSEVMSLPGRRVMLLGYGDIGATLAPVLRLLGADLTIVARHPRNDAALGQIHALKDLDALLPRAEIIIAALPSTPETIGLLNGPRLMALPQGAMLVNVGRGDVLEEAGLVAALTSGHLGGVALDVFVTEPLPATSPYWHLPRLLLSPHVAAFGDRDSGAQLAAQVLGNMARAKQGLPPIGLVCTGTRRPG